MKQKHKLIKKIKKMLKKDQQVNIPVMDKIHKTLSSKSLVYKSWHTSQWQHITQWAVLASVVIIVGGLFYFRSTDPLVEPLSSSAAQVWNAREAELENLTEKLLVKGDDYAKGDELSKQIAANDMKALAKQRFDLIKLALDSGKLSMVLDNTISNQERSKLSADAAVLVEEQKDTTGLFEWGVIDYIDGRSQNLLSITAADGNKYQLLFDQGTNFPESESGARIEVPGFVFSGLSKIIVDPNRGIEEVDPAPPTVEGSVKTAVVMFNFPNMLHQPITVDQARRAVFTDSLYSAKDYFSEVSEGNINIVGHVNPTQGDVFGWVTLPINYNVINADCYGSQSGQNSWYGQANSAAAAAYGFNPANYDRIIYVTPGNPNAPGNNLCPGAAGYAAYGSNVLYIHYAASMLITTTHELGHTFGRRHASTLVCTNGSGIEVQISGNCSLENEYGDPFDVMAAGPYKHMNAYEKSKTTDTAESWVSPSQVQEVSSTSPQGQTFNLAPANQSTSGLKYLKIPKSLSVSGVNMNGHYYLEFRQHTGIDGSGGGPVSPFYSGVSIRFASEENNSRGRQSYLINANPGGNSSEDWPLAVGQTFTDADMALSIQTISAGPSGVTVKVIINAAASCQRVAPTLTITPNNVPLAQGQTGSFNALVTNNDSAGCAASNFTLYPPSLNSNYVSAPASQVMSLVPGAQASRSFTVTPTATADLGMVWTYAYAYHGSASGLNTSANLQFTITQGTVPTCTNTNPTLSITPTTGAATIGSSATYNFTLRNNDAAACTSSTYSVSPQSVPANWTMTPSTFSETLAPGASVTKSFAFGAPLNATVGPQTITLRAIRNGSSSILGSANFTHTAQGGTSVDGPVVYISSPTNGYIFSSGTLNINTTTEVVGGFIQSVEIKLDDRVVKTCNTLTYNFMDCNHAMDYYGTKMSLGNHTITVTAVEYGTNQVGTSTRTFTKAR